MTTPKSPARSHPGASLIAKTFEDGGKHYTAVSVTFLLACLYVLVAVSSTTHRILLLGGSLPLPLLNVPTPLTGFFVVAPALILILHVHLLVQNHVLVRRLRDKRTFELGGDEDLLLFPALPFLDNLWGDNGGFRVLISSANLFINGLLPLVLLCYTQYKFVPYHSFGITLCHQIFVVLDIIVFWYFLVQLPGRGLSRIVMPLVASLALFFSFFQAIVPDTWIESKWKNFPPAALLTRNLELSDELLIEAPPPPELLAVSEEQGKDPMTPFVMHAVGARLAGRDLRYAALEKAKLFNADLRGADLSGAWLVGADLRGANMTPPGQSALMQQPRSRQKSDEIAKLAKTPIRRTRLDRAKLRDVDLNGAKLILVSMQFADLRGAKLPGVELTGANVREALLNNADLTGSELSYATLDGSRLDNAGLVEATLNHASLAGSSLRGIHAGNASFVDAKMEGAQFTEARLREVDFRDARLAGTDFRRASLQGAKSLMLEAVDLRGAHLGGACDIDFAKLVDLRSVDFLSSEYWDTLLVAVPKGFGELSLSAADFHRELDRVAAANQPLPDDLQAACLGLALGMSEYRLLMYDDDARKGPMKDWPPLQKQRNGRWDEAVFHRELAKELLDRACSSEGLATTLVRRAAGEYNPGDLDFDLELADQLLRKVEGEETCAELQKLDAPWRRQIAWRLGRAAREAGH